MDRFGTSRDSGKKQSRAEEEASVSKLYSQALESGKKRWNFLKVLLVGDTRAGKTSHIRALQGLEFIDTPSTDGIEIKTCTVKAHDEQWTEQHPELTFDDVILKQRKEGISTQPVRIEEPPPKVKERLDQLLWRTQLAPFQEPLMLSVWDFAGQEIYYHSHNLFFSERAIYLLVINLAKPLNFKAVEYWIHSIRSLSPDSPFIIVGTHSDLVDDSDERLVAYKDLNVSKEEQLEMWLNDQVNGKTVYQVTSTIVVSNKDPKLVTRVRSLIHQKAAEMIDSLPEVPVKMAQFMEELSKSPNQLVSLTAVNDVSQRLNISKENEELFLVMLDQFGFILNFGKTLNHIVLNPQWVADVIKCIITKESLEKRLRQGLFSRQEQQEASTGTFTKKVLTYLWKDFLSDQLTLEHLKSLMIQYHLAAYQTKESSLKFLVPAYFPVNPEAIQASGQGTSLTLELSFSLRVDGRLYPFLPIHTMVRVIANILQHFEEYKMELVGDNLWRNRIQLQMADHYLDIQEKKEESILVTVSAFEGRLDTSVILKIVKIIEEECPSHWVFTPKVLCPSATPKCSSFPLKDFLSRPTVVCLAQHRTDTTTLLKPIRQADLPPEEPTGNCTLLQRLISIRIFASLCTRKGQTNVRPRITAYNKEGQDSTSTTFSSSSYSQSLRSVNF